MSKTRSLHFKQRELVNRFWMESADNHKRIFANETMKPGSSQKDNVNLWFWQNHQDTLCGHHYITSFLLITFPMMQAIPVK
ncbi:MAG: hypothetical protein LLF95_02500 [Bacteroidales bacterium]|nr:hypothetical protein [Bacteroidales bacterium]